MRKFKINKDWNGIGVELHQKGTVTLQPGVTVLVGCNGIGKTTLIKQLIQLLEKENVPVIKFDNLRDGGANARSNALRRYDFSFAATAMQSSEGENICMNMGNFVGQVGALQRKHPDAKELFIFIDAADSGLSIDNILEIKDVFNLILSHRGDTEVYIVISANAYEVARGENCYDVLRCRYLKFSSYERYRQFVLKTREIKDQRVRKDEEACRRGKRNPDGRKRDACT